MDGEPAINMPSPEVFAHCNGPKLPEKLTTHVLSTVDKASLSSLYVSSMKVLRSHILVLLALLLVVWGSVAIPAKASLKFDSESDLRVLVDSLLISEGIQILSDVVIEANSDFITRHIILDVPAIPGLGPIEIKKRDPIVKGQSTFPTAVLLTGLQTGMDSVRLAPPTPRASVVSLNYPIRTGSMIDSVMSTIENIWRIQAHIFVVFTWLRHQWDVDATRLSSVNVSFGSFISPLPLRLLKQTGFIPHVTVFAFGGGTIMPFIDHMLKTEVNDKNLRRGIRAVLSPVAKVLEPRQHLKKLEGPFLVVRGTNDQIIPKESSDALVGTLRGHAEVINLEGPHIDASRPQIIFDTTKIIFDWIHNQPERSEN